MRVSPPGLLSTPVVMGGASPPGSADDWIAVRGVNPGRIRAVVAAVTVLASGCTAGAGALPWNSEPTELVQVEKPESAVPTTASTAGVGLAPGKLDDAGVAVTVDGPEAGTASTVGVGPRSFIDERGRISATMIWYQRVVDSGLDLDAVAEVNLTLIPIEDPGSEAVAGDEGGSDSAVGDTGGGQAGGYLVRGRVAFTAPDTICRRFGAVRDCEVAELVDADLVGVASRRGNRLVVALDWRHFGPESVPGRPLVRVRAMGEQALSGGSPTAESDAVGRALADSGLIGEFDLSLTIPQARRFHSRVGGSGSGFMELVPTP